MEKENFRYKQILGWIEKVNDVKYVGSMLETKKVLWRTVEGTLYYLSVMFHHKNHLTRSLTREATGVRLEPDWRDHWTRPNLEQAKYFRQEKSESKYSHCHEQWNVKINAELSCNLAIHV